MWTPIDGDKNACRNVGEGELRTTQSWSQSFFSRRTTCGILDSQRVGSHGHRLCIPEHFNTEQIHGHAKTRLTAATFTDDWDWPDHSGSIFTLEIIDVSFRGLFTGTNRAGHSSTQCLLHPIHSDSGQCVPIHPDLVLFACIIQCGVHHVREIVYHVQCGGKEFDLLSPRHSWPKKYHAGLQFQLLKTALKFNGIVGDQNPVFLFDQFQDLPVLRPMQPVVIDLGSRISPCVSRLRQDHGQVLTSTRVSAISRSLLKVLFPGRIAPDHSDNECEYGCDARDIGNLPPQNRRQLLAL